MPIHIIRQDITKMECDAIVNAANSSLLGGGGVDGAIHKAAGRELLEECKTLGGCKTGDAKVTKGYNLSCKYVIHTVGPIWNGGHCGEKQLLESCYATSLALAKAKGCETIAFPLISSGVYGYPKDKALAVAMETIQKFLLENEMTVYVVLFDKASCQISKSLYDNVAEYIDDNYAGARLDRERRRRDMPMSCVCSFAEKDLTATPYQCIKSIDTLEDMLSRMDDSFAVTLLKLIDMKGMSDVECYKRANASKQTWYKIINEKNYKPSKNTVISFAIALRLTLSETKRLLSTVGFALSRSNKFDIIIEYFLLNGVYDIYTINETLFQFDQVCLAV